jgi:hypothetical protein
MADLMSSYATREEELRAIWQRCERIAAACEAAGRHLAMSLIAITRRFKPLT